MITLKRTDGSIIAECDTDNMAEAVVMNGANLRGANLRGANLFGANLFGANLREANLRGADLCEADLYRANLSEADLSEADLSRAYFREADISGAYLYRANLSGVDLHGANLYGAILRGAKGISSIGPIASEGRTIYAVNHIDKIMVQAGCFWDDLEEFKQAVEEKHGDNQHGVAYRAAIEFIFAYAKTYKWSEVKAQ